MRVIHHTVPAFICFAILIVALTCASPPARATIQSFSGPWDPTNPFNGFSLRATDPGGSASMSLTPDLQTLTFQLTLTNCHSGCRAFYLDNATGALPHGEVQFDWIVELNDRTTDGQIAIDGADLTVNDGARDIPFYPSTFSGSADINYQGGVFTFFDIGIGAADTGSTTATVQLTYFSGPDAPISNAGQSGNAPINVSEPGAWAGLLLALGALYRVRRSPPG